MNSSFVVAEIAPIRGTIAFRQQPHPRTVHLCLFARFHSKYQVIEQSGRRHPTSEITCLTSDIHPAEGVVRNEMPKCAAREKQWFHNFGRPTVNSSKYDVRTLISLVQLLGGSPQDLLSLEYKSCLFW